MKRALSITLIFMLIFALPVFAEPVAGAKTELTVGSTTPMSGSFFTDMWGNNTADMDVRALIHGLSTIAWKADGAYAADEVVLQQVEIQPEADGGKTYIMQLKDGLVYNDASPITAKDYVFSVLLQSAPQTAAIGATIGSMGHLVGYEAFSKGESQEFSGVRLLDDKTFSLTIKAENLPYFYELMMVNVTPYPISEIAPGCEVADDGKGAYIKGDFTAELLKKTILSATKGYLSHPKVTSGAYVLASYDAAKRVAVFTANENYPGNFEGKKPEVKKLTFKSVSNANIIKDFKEGKLDIINKITDGDVINQGRELVNADQARMVNYLRTGFSFLSFACEEGITASLPVRQAILMCMDVDALSTEYLQGYGMPVYGYYGYGQWMANESRETLEQLDTYSFNPTAAVALLEAEGWTLNALKKPFTPGVDKTRYKLVDDQLVQLEINWAKVPNNAADKVEKMLTENMAAIGMKLRVKELPFDEMLKHYYRQEKRTYDMFFMATNFTNIFDPYFAFSTDDAFQGVYNTTGIKDEKLMKLAEDMRKTDSADLEGYTTKWLAFQNRFHEVLPMAPLYSNIYFDMFLPTLYGYETNAQWSWAAAIINATFTPPVEAEVAPAEATATPAAGK